MAELKRVLVSAPDRRMRDAVRRSLAGLEILEATEEVTTGALAAACRPDVLVLDATDADRASSTIEALRNEFRTALLARVYIVDRPPSAEIMATAFGGADDYVVCPFDDEELAARVSAAMHRTESRRGLNPLTALPGNAAVTDQIEQRLASGVAFALLHIDIDDFKRFNDRHGFARGDEVIRIVAGCVVESLGEGCFAGHVGGDDFVVLAPRGSGEAYAADIVGRFDAQGTGCALSIGVVRSVDGERAAEIAARAARAKAVAKDTAGSSWSVLS